jgi:hypothetical protein
VLYKLAPVGLRDALLHPRDEAGLIVEHAGNSVFNQLLGILAIGRGHLLEPRFDVGGEMYFHAFKLRENREPGNHRRAKAPEIRASGSPARPGQYSEASMIVKTRTVCFRSLGSSLPFVIIVSQ